MIRRPPRSTRTYTSFPTRRSSDLDINFDLDFTDPELNRFQGFFIVPQEDNDRLWAYAGDLTWRVDGSFVKSIEVGARYSDRRDDRTVTAFNLFGIYAPVALPAGVYDHAAFGGHYGAHRWPYFLSVALT